MGDSANQEPATGPFRRLVHSLANLTASIIEAAETRLALLGTELQEEVYRAAALLLSAVIAIFLGLPGLVMAGFALVIASWYPSWSVPASSQFRWWSQAFWRSNCTQDRQCSRIRWRSLGETDKG
jgi:uncharacterized membrane protein YqjE